MGGGGEGWNTALGRRGISWGFSIWKPARILPLSPTNIMPSAGRYVGSDLNGRGRGRLEHGAGKTWHKLGIFDLEAGQDFALIADEHHAFGREVRAIQDRKSVV